MSAVSVAPSTPLPTATKVPFGRLVLVEWRKMTDTRAGRWLTIATAGMLVVVGGLVLLIAALNDYVVSSRMWMGIFGLILSLLLPVMAMVIVTQEWGQRTAMVTFVLEPSRFRVLVAKLVAVIALAAVATAVAFGLGALFAFASAALQGESVQWDLETRTVVFALIRQAVYLLMGFGFALLLLSTPISIVVYYVYTQMLSVGILGTISVILAVFVALPGTRDVLPWFDLNLALLPFELTGSEYGAIVGESGFRPDGTNIAQLVSAVTIWVVLPLVLGTLRVLKSEVK